ncbi:MAG: hypothetical protein IGS03_06665 [Candidatus Sericytochromatia bacterium]|nr:hypothetical protein [Candidatus Sericytochromatia bacterium]
MTIRRSDAVQKLCSLLVKHDLVSATDISIAYQTYILMKIQAAQCQYVLEAEKGVLALQSRDDAQDSWGALEMPAPAVNAEALRQNWVPFTSDKLALFDASGRFQSVQARSRPEIVPTSQGGYIWANNQSYQLSVLLNPLLPLQNVARGPYDFYFPAGQDDGVFFTDRAQGSLLMSDLTLNLNKARLSLREPGSTKALCLAYDGQTHTAYVTDHQTSDLIVIQPFKKDLQRISTPHGVLGSLVLDGSRQQLLMLLADPEQEPAVLVYDTATLQHKGTILVPGKRFSTLDDPCDLMAVSPDGHSLLIMSYTDEPALCTPLISRIDLQSHQLLETQTLSTQEKPIGFAFAQQAPQSEALMDFDDFLADRGLVEMPRMIGLIRQIQALEADRNKPLFDQDVQAAMQHIQGNFSPQELQNVVEMSQEAVQQLSNESFFEWQGRQDMNAEEKQVFVEHLAQLKTDESVSRTNGVFVLNWLKGLAR